MPSSGRLKNITSKNWNYSRPKTKSCIGHSYVDNIRASTNALYRDGTGQISRDPRTKCQKIRWEWLAMPSKYTNTCPYLALHLTGTSWSAIFSQNISKWCARTSSDRFLFVASHCGRSWSSSMRDTERRYLLLTRQAVSSMRREQGASSWCMKCRMRIHLAIVVVQAVIDRHVGNSQCPVPSVS